MTKEIKHSNKSNDTMRLFLHGCVAGMIITMCIFAAGYVSNSRERKSDKNKTLLAAQSKVLSEYEQKCDSLENAHKHNLEKMNSAFWCAQDSIKTSSASAKQKDSALTELSDNYRNSTYHLNEELYDALAKEWAKCDSIYKAYKAQLTR